MQNYIEIYQQDQMYILSSNSIVGDINFPQITTNN